MCFCDGELLAERFILDGFIFVKYACVKQFEWLWYDFKKACFFSASAIQIFRMNYKPLATVSLSSRVKNIMLVDDNLWLKTCNV